MVLKPYFHNRIVTEHMGAFPFCLSIPCVVLNGLVTPGLRLPKFRTPSLDFMERLLIKLQERCMFEDFGYKSIAGDSLQDVWNQNPQI